MTEKEFIASIRFALNSVLDLGLLGSVRNLSSLKPSSEFKEAAFDRFPDYTRLHAVGLRNQDFNFILKDDTFFQFYYQFELPICGLRYSFLPSPSPRISQEAFLREFGIEGDEEGIEELWDLYVEEKLSSGASPAPLIRYDLSIPQYSELAHPASHFHFGTHSKNRWPCAHVVSPLLFTLQMLKMFYSETWQSHHGVAHLEELLADGKRECALLDESFFSQNERSQPFFG